ncbi:group III truncated hemoglobin [Sphingomonas sp. KRR8]|uniref:group III truncated hemoglobin n=1 Tax=Sphingomonas sp. KRR8 TaxID=2942996 RepID=UPI002022733F|nr:group III truncated hemoglobin [Sphingomonas sp. KRR8]URD60535.1 group III truncated hemoglobin [Sphingomonas sp. KRR8]
MTAPESHAVQAREAKRTAAAAIGIDDRFVSDLVEQFYDSVRDDTMLGPIFAERIGNWPNHLEQMKRFWRSILFSSGEFFGSPMAKHVAIPGLDRDHFLRWLELFHSTLDELGPAAASAHVYEKARSIAASLLNGIRIHRDGTLGLSRDEALV